ncbi:MAG: hypothetical protein RIQ93_1630 [Verrucomicrobiota bacterium]
MNENKVDPCAASGTFFAIPTVSPQDVRSPGNGSFPDPISRRHFIALTSALAGSVAFRVEGAVIRNAAWAGEVGVTTSSFFRHMIKDGTDRYFDLYELPKVMRDELGMKVIDLNTGTLDTRDPAKLDRFRKALDDAGCVATNLKVNATRLGVKILDLPIDGPDRATRVNSLDGYREWILAAHRVGVRWVRPYFSERKPDLGILSDSLMQLADFADPLSMTIVLENGGWVQSDPDAIPRLVAATRGRIAATPDIGAWEKGAREPGLKNAFPHAVSCDFKVGKLGRNGAHTAYDIRRCFELGWQAGFRGPWWHRAHGRKHHGIIPRTQIDSRRVEDVDARGNCGGVRGKVA